MKDGRNSEQDQIGYGFRLRRSVIAVNGRKEKGEGRASLISNSEKYWKGQQRAYQSQDFPLEESHDRKNCLVLILLPYPVTGLEELQKNVDQCGSYDRAIGVESGGLWPRKIIIAGSIEKCTSKSERENNRNKNGRREGKTLKIEKK